MKMKSQPFVRLITFIRRIFVIVLQVGDSVQIALAFILLGGFTASDL